MNAPGIAAADLPVGLLIGDRWITDTPAGEMEHVNAVTGTVQRRFPIASEKEVDAAVCTATEALATWRGMGAVGRRACLTRLASLLREHAEEFTTISTLETAATLSLTSYQANAAAEWFDYYAGWADKVRGEVIDLPGAFDYTLAEPVGVVAVLITWNGPTAAVGMTCAAPLAAGCTVVLKAPELAPFSSTLFGRLCLEAGIPPGVINIVTGGPEVGNALVTHPGVAKISFTGSGATARKIQAAIAPRLIPSVLELGGKSASLIFEDADLETAIAEATFGVCLLNGQTCIAPTRLIVQRAVYEEVVDGVVKGMSKVRLGDPLDPVSEMGPVITEGAMSRILAMIDAATADGSGQLVTGGHRSNGSLKDGFFVEPTVFRDVDNSSDLAQHELFGPVLAVIPFDSEDEGVRIANDTEFGLAAYLATSDLSRAHRVAAQLDAGNIAVNGGISCAGPQAPFGGVKSSGFGVVGAEQGLSEFLKVKNVNIKMS